jgi:3-hydroxymyristoyl/3-hydroxydecanoyl-(acyl carrier protein) dehydratase
MKFRLVDRILAYEPKESICGVKTVSFEEYQLKEAFFGAPALPESLLMESLFQLGQWLIMLSSNFTKMGLVVEAGRVEFHSQLKPGERLTLDVHVQDYQADSIQFNGQAQSGSRTVASCIGCIVRLAAIEQYYDPSDMRVLFSEIYRPVVRTRNPQG